MSQNKKGKKKGKTLSLNAFLNETPSVSGNEPVKSVSLNWADESDDMHSGNTMSYSSYSNASKPKVINLPTAPRSSRQVEVDMSRVPNQGPFTAYMGNLPYECDERMLADFFGNLPIVNVRLPMENGRFKGFGYVEFADRGSLIEALKKNDEVLQKRAIRVDIAGSQNKDQGMSGGFGGRSRYNNSSYGAGGGPDPTESNWRSAAQENPPPQPRYQSGGFSRDNDRYGDGGRRDYDGGRRPGGYSTYNRGPPRDDYNSYDRNSSGGGGGGYGRQWSNERRQGSDGFDDYGRSGQRDSFSSGGRRNNFGGSRYGSESGGPPPPMGEPRERSKLNLQPRQKPVDSGNEPTNRPSSIFGGAKPVNTADREREIEEKIQKQEDFKKPAPPKDRPVTESRSKNVFGGAKPVDTSAREREIEEKLKMQQIKAEGSERRYEARSSASGRHSRSSSRYGDDDYENDSVKSCSRTASSSAVRSGGEDCGPAAAASTSAAAAATGSGKREFRPAPAPSMNAWSKKLTQPAQSLLSDARKGEREEAEGNDDEAFERTPEGAAADDVKSARAPPGDGRESSNRTTSYRRAGDYGGQPGRSDGKWERNRPANDDSRRSSGSGYSDRRRKGDGDSNSENNRGTYNSRNRSGGPSYNRNRDGRRDDEDETGKSKRAPAPIKKLEAKAPVDFVTSSKFALLAAEDDDDNSSDEVTAPVVADAEKEEQQ